MKAKEIREINDTIRTKRMLRGKIDTPHGEIHGMWYMTRIVSENPLMEKILDAIANFKDFNKDNNPYKEHDFGKVKVGSEEFLFKFSYYDKDPTRYADAVHGFKFFVMTIMEASEY